MIVRNVKASAKGQLTLPVDVLRALGASGPTEFMLVQEGTHILLVTPEEYAQGLVDDLGGWSALAAPAFAAVWDSPEDEVWDDA